LAMSNENWVLPIHAAAISSVHCPPNTTGTATARTIEMKEI
jgi:hypothetical protein